MCLKFKMSYVSYNMLYIMLFKIKMDLLVLVLGEILRSKNLQIQMIYRTNGGLILSD